MCYNSNGVSYMDKITMKKDINIFNEYCKKMKIITIIFFIVAALGLAGMLLDIFLFDFNYIGFCIATFFFVFPFFGGIEQIKTIKKEKKEFKTMLNREDVFTFDDTYLTWIQNEGETEIFSYKFFYKDLLYFRLTKTYASVYYNKEDCIPITKSDELVEYLKSKSIKQK